MGNYCCCCPSPGGYEPIPDCNGGSADPGAGEVRKAMGHLESVLAQVRQSLEEEEEALRPDRARKAALEKEDMGPGRSIAGTFGRTVARNYAPLLNVSFGKRGDLKRLTNSLAERERDLARRREALERAAAMYRDVVAAMDEAEKRQRCNLARPSAEGLRAAQREWDGLLAKYHEALAMVREPEVEHD